MADIGRASLLIVPRFDNLTRTVNDALQRAGATASRQGQGLGESASRGFGSGLAKSGALVGAFSALTNSALSSISSHVGAAVSRFDTLNQYPRTMELLGYSSESAEASISKMSDRLSSLPTTLDSMTSTVQGIVAITGDLDQATDAGLALNDMLVASGSSQQLATAAMEQFRQMLAKGKPEMEDWKSLTSAMPGQMAQLAQAMLGPTATANDLYYALGGGGEDPTVTMDELMAAMIRLDNEGGEGITSFREQAETAAGGVQTAMANMGNAVTKGIASVMDEIGQDRISGALNDIKGGINDAFGAARDVVGAVVPALSEVYDNVAPIAPQVVTMTAAFAAFNGVGQRIPGALKGIRFGLEGIVSGISPLSVGIGLAAGALALLVTSAMDAAEREENLAAATTGLNDVVADTAALDGYRGTVDGVGESAAAAAMSVDELAEATSERVEVMRENTESAEAEIAQLNTAQGIINQYAGQTDLTAAAQGRLQWALKLVNDELGLNITQSDVAAGSYENQDGEVQDLTESLNELIERKKEEARVSAVSANLTEAYEAQSEAAKTLAAAQQDYNDKVDWFLRNSNMSREQAIEAANNAPEGQALRDATEMYEDATEAVSSYEGQLGEAAAAASEAADEYDRLSATMSGNGTFALFSAQLEQAGTSFGLLSDDLRDLGADTEAFAGLSSEQLQQLASSYDGTAASIVGLLSEWGVSMDETAAATAEVSAALAGMSESASIDLGALASALAGAGVRASELNAIGTSNLDALAAAVGGDVDAMVWAVQNWNALPFLSKDGSVTVEDGQLVDAQGNVWTWNGTAFESKTAAATVNTNVDWAISQIENWNNNVRLKSKYATVKLSMASGGVVGGRLASGGVIGHAEGGVVRHADGFIANRPGAGVPIHVVGEAGAEAVVPLTNRRYSQPFVDLVADGVSERVGGAAGAEAIVSAIASLRDQIAEMGVYIDGGKLVGQITPQVNRSLGRVQRRGSLA